MAVIKEAGHVMSANRGNKTGNKDAPCKPNTQGNESQEVNFDKKVLRNFRNKERRFGTFTKEILH